ncbi:hypothetical protein [Thalassotalea aquiviva]|uniref:hypothetical protein n=1 Tax=Thalassotalea aquiviva TaxID=3242415 RepID=UPI003529D86E
MKIKHILSIFIATLSISLVPAATAKSDNSDFYTFDFERKSYSMKDVEQQFFTTFPHDDPTAGDVIYDRKLWKHDNMIELKNQDGLFMYIRSRDDVPMFDSVRLTSKAYYNIDNNETILFVFKGKLPSANGLWPAWWLNGGQEPTWLYAGEGKLDTDKHLDSYSGVGHFYNTPSPVNPTDWPAAGEIDIIENINGHKTIHNTLHTCPQMFDGQWNDSTVAINCANANSSDPNPGCSGTPYEIEKPEGTFAIAWQKDTIKYYYWNSKDDVRKEGGPLSENPDLAMWDKQSLKNTVKLLPGSQSCDASVHEPWQCKSCKGSEDTGFVNMKVIFNITTCGKWAGLQFDDTPEALANCKAHILGEGKSDIDSQSIKIEYLSVKKL